MWYDAVIARAPSELSLEPSSPTKHTSLKPGNKGHGVTEDGNSPSGTDFFGVLVETPISNTAQTSLIRGFGGVEHLRGCLTQPLLIATSLRHEVA